MIRYYGPGMLLVMALWIYALLDVIQTDEILTRNLPKNIWVLLVLLFPPVGPMAWLIAGRPLYVGWAPGGSQSQPQGQRRPGAVAPEDRPGWRSSSAAISGPTAEELQRWEDDLARREREIPRPDDPGDQPT